MSRQDRNDDPGRKDEGGDREGPVEKPARREPPETTRHPAPGIEHEPEPSSENLIPAKDRPGTI